MQEWGSFLPAFLPPVQNSDLAIPRRETDQNAAAPPEGTKPRASDTALDSGGGCGLCPNVIRNVDYFLFWAAAGSGIRREAAALLRQSTRILAACLSSP